jgi:hypothetical protein
MSCAQATVKEKSPSFVLIGYKEQTPYFNAYGDKNLYYYDGEFKIRKTAPDDGFYPCFINDNCEIYKSINVDDKRIILYSEFGKRIIDLKNSPDVVIANTIGDNIYFSAGSEYDYLNIYDVTKDNLIKGLKVYYEGLWYTNKGLVYFVPTIDNEGINNGTLYVGDGLNQENAAKIIDGFYLFNFVTKDCKYAFGHRYNHNGIEECCLIDIENNNIKIIDNQYIKEHNWVFYYMDNLVFYKPGQKETNSIKNPFKN